MELWIDTVTDNHQGFSALHYASFNGNPQMIRYLVNKGANIQARNAQGMNMLHLAA